MTKATAKAWMRAHLQGDNGSRLIDRRTGEVNMTLLAENAAHHFDHDEWLDEETHWIWDAAHEVAVWIERGPR